MSNIEQGIPNDEVKSPVSSFGVRYSLFDLPAVPVNRFHVELPSLNWHGFRSVTKHFAGQAGILRFVLELLRALRRVLL
jgi:hypothetical protein